MSFGTRSDRDTDGLFRLVVDRLPLLGWISDPDKRCTYFNKPWLDFTGRPLESEIGDGWAEGVHAADLQRCTETYTRAFDRREPFMMEYRLRRYDGEYRWVLHNAAPVFDPDGSFAGYICAAFDVTEFRRAEAERNVANGRLQLAMESGKSVGWESLRRKEIELQEAQRLAGVGSWQWEPDTDTVVWSEELSRIAGRDPSLPPVTLQGTLTALYQRELGSAQKCRRSGPPHRHTLRTRSGDGSP